MIKLKRVYEPPEKNDGLRILVERLWPRGISKERAKVDLWLKDGAPSTELREWFSHDPAKWEEFKKRYYKELETKKEMFSEIKKAASESIITFVFAARDVQHNSAVVLKTFIESLK
jgi:uncharacterized protein YeaO (DUF488 family)